MRPYDELPGLEHLHLEDSFVLGVDERDGGIDFLQWDGDRYDIAGDWGRVRFRSAPPEVGYPPDPPGR